MSLKAFHILFIALATLVTAGFGLWALGPTNPGGVWMGWVSLAAAVVLPVYGRWFLAKTQGVSFL